MIETSFRTAVDVAGFVLAGGQSKRMGQDKALVQVAGRPLIEQALGILQEAGLPAVIAGARTELGKYATVIPDDGQGPLNGICAALRSTGAEFSVFLPVDMPLLPPELVRVLVDHATRTGAPIMLAKANGFGQTFPAVVHRSAQQPLASELAAGRLGCFAAFATAAQKLGQPLKPVSVEMLVQAREVAHPLDIAPAFWFLNVNCPEHLDQADEMLSSRHQVS